jgi:hypothetical protein
VFDDRDTDKVKVKKPTVETGANHNGGDNQYHHHDHETEEKDEGIQGLGDDDGRCAACQAAGYLPGVVEEENPFIAMRMVILLDR